MEEAFDRFGQEMPAMAFDPAMLADTIAELTRRKPWIMRLIFEHPDVRAAYTRVITESCMAGEQP